MKKLLYLFTLIALSVGLTCVQAASPTYDDNPPPSYIWGSGEINSQTSGTPNKNSDEKQVDILRDVNVNVGSITVDTGTIKNDVGSIKTNSDTIKNDVGDIRTEVASMSSNLANAILSGSLAEQEVSYTVGSISVDTSNIESCLREDDKTVAALVNNIGTDTKNIENKLKVDNKSITEFINNIATDTKNLGTEVASISHNIGSLLDETIPYIRSQRLSISPEIVTQITPVVGSGGSKRVFVELRAVDENSVFYLGFGSGATDSNGRPVKGRILLNMGTGQNLYVYHTNASALAIQQTEGWR